METIFMKTGNSKTNQPHQFVLNLSELLDLRNSNKHAALQNFSIYHMRKNIRKQYRNNKLKTISPIWTGEFELPNGSYFVPDIPDYIECIIKKHKALTTIPPIHVYINRINNRLVFKMKYGYKLELQRPE